MPIYEYECQKCGAVFEMLVRNAEERVQCENCGARRVKKIVSSFSAGAGSCNTGGST